jgi:hypothetical protein
VGKTKIERCQILNVEEERITRGGNPNFAPLEPALDGSINSIYIFLKLN